MSEQRKSPSMAGAVLGLLVVAVGVVFLLVELGVIPYETAILSWPLALVVLGLVKLIGRGTLQDRLFGGGLIAAGALLEAHQLDYVDLSWSVIWPLLVVFVGVHILAGSLARHRRPHARAKVTADGLDEHVIFGGRESRYDGDAFEGGAISATFGGVNLDLSHADFPGDEVVIDARALFGGVEIRVPRHWQVVLKGTPILGAFEDKTRTEPDASEAPAKRLVITGQAMFGGVEVKN
jgi:predicted membrane protein